MFVNKNYREARSSDRENMAPQNEPDLYDSLSNDVYNLRDLGASWGLSENQIDECIQKALAVDEKPKTSRVRQACFCIVGIISVMACTSLLLTAVTLNKTTRLFVTKHSQSIAYPLMRGIRLLTLPIARTFDLRGWHDMECLINNPLHATGPPDCYPCQNVQDIQSFHEPIQNFTDKYYNYGIPIVTKDPLRNLVFFKDLRDIYLANRDTFEYNAYAVECSNSYINHISEILHPEKTAEDIGDFNIRLQWRVIKAGSMRLIRMLSPKPYFIPEKGEVASEMFVFIDAPGAEAHLMPTTFFGNSWLTQASGSREISLSPLPTCVNNCTEVSIVLEPRDILYYSGYFWQLKTFPFGDDLSIQFLGSFY